MPRATAEPPNVLEVIVGQSYGSRDADLADAARRWWKLSSRRRDQLEFIVARRRWAEDPLAVFRITSGRAVEGGRLEFEVQPADADDEARVLAAVGDLGVCNSALRLSGPDSEAQNSYASPTTPATAARKCLIPRFLQIPYTLKHP